MTRPRTCDLAHSGPVPDQPEPPAVEPPVPPPQGAHAGHGHSHGSLRLQTANRQTARVVTLLAIVCMAGAIVGLVVLRPRGPGPKAPAVTRATVFVDGTVRDITPLGCPGTNGEIDTSIHCATVHVVVTSGPTKGQAGSFPATAGDYSLPHLHTGNKIRMGYVSTAPQGYRYSFVDFQRRRPLVLLLLLFAGAVLVLGRWQGLRSLIGMALSLLAILAFLLPALLRGGPPLELALVTAVVVAVFVLYLAHGFHTGTHVALLGSVGALVLTTILGVAFTSLTRLTGLQDENTLTLVATAGKLNIRGLLLAGVVIGALGVLNDVTVTQVSAVSELHEANPLLRGRRLYQAGLRVGRDHIASTVNTLVLAYAGASLVLLLIFVQGGRSVLDILTSDVVAVEIVRTLVGSIGLVAAVPLTTALATRVVSDTPPFSWKDRRSARRDARKSTPEAWGTQVDDEGWPVARDTLDL